MDHMKKEMLSKRIIDEMNNDQEFCRAFVSSADASSLQKVLSDHGYEITTEEIEALYGEGVNGIMNYEASGEELSEDQLEDVAGGGFLRGTLRFAASCAVGFGYGCLCGVCPAAYAYAPHVATGLAVWTAAGYVKKGW